jgi:hypothetical protein
MLWFCKHIILPHVVIKSCNLAFAFPNMFFWGCWICEPKLFLYLQSTCNHNVSPYAPTH